MINSQWLKLPMSRTNFKCPKDSRAIEVRLSIHYLYDHIFLRAVNIVEITCQTHMSHDPPFTDTRYNDKIRSYDNLTDTKP